MITGVFALYFFWSVMYCIINTEKLYENFNGFPLYFVSLYCLTGWALFPYILFRNILKGEM